jgi:flagellar M-ring protein FliF
MAASLKKLTDKINEFWTGLNKKQKTKIIALSLIILLGIILLVYFINKPTYALLFGGLKPEDAGAVADTLDSEYKVPYKLENGGTSIYVPEKDRDKLRIELASSDILDDGFNIDDAFSGSMSTTDMERTKKYYYFLQNEISNAIKTIDGIKDATVLISSSEDTPMVLNEDEKPTTAAVKVDMSSGNQLSQDQVNGIIQFVSKSVSGLKPENVTVMNSNGESLMDNTSTAGSANTQMKLKREVEDTLKTNLQGMLERIYGPGNIIVSVSAPVDFDYYKKDSTSYDPNSNEMGDIINEKSAIRSYQQLKQNSAGGQNGGGAAGTSSNVTPTYPTTGSGNNASTSDNTNSVINYELNEIKEEFVRAQGQIDTNQISVSVAINSAKLTNTEVENVRNLIKNAVGLTGDIEQITVLGQKFVNHPSDDSQAQPQNSTLPYLLLALISAMAMGGLLLVRRRNIKKREALAQERETETATENIGSTIAPMVPIEDIEVKDDKNDPKRQINRLIKQKPEMVAQLVRTWLNEE